jgi:hypothetical protein
MFQTRVSFLKKILDNFIIIIYFGFLSKYSYFVAISLYHFLVRMRSHNDKRTKNAIFVSSSKEAIRVYISACEANSFD